MEICFQLLHAKKGVSSNAFLWTKHKRFYEGRVSQFPKSQLISSESYKISVFCEKVSKQKYVFHFFKAKKISYYMIHDKITISFFGKISVFIN
jgi:hypothetical protein